MVIIGTETISIYSRQFNRSISSTFATGKQKVVFIIPPLLMASMYFIFNHLAAIIEDQRIAWYIGITSYWIIWGLIFPLFIVGTQGLKDLLKPQQLTWKIALLLSIPLLGAAGAKLVPGMGEYEKNTVLIFFLVISTAFGNGFFEELLWRGVYTRLFPNNLFLRMIWPALWFGLWHYIPVSINNHEISGLVGMTVGPIMMGLYLGYLTHKTKTIWWAIIVHTIGGLIMVI